MKFIRVKDLDKGSDILINLEKVTDIFENTKKETVICFSADDYINTSTRLNDIHIALNFSGWMLFDFTNSNDLKEKS
jgi:hypothetical protein